MATVSLCAGCGREITDTRSQPSLCEACEDKIQASDTAWQQKKEVNIERDQI